MNGTQCTANCPVTCGPEEQMCSGGTDMNGCMMPDSCYPMMVVIWISNVIFSFNSTLSKEKHF